MAERFRKKYDPESVSQYTVSAARRKYDPKFPEGKAGKEEIKDLAKRFTKKVFYPDIAFGKYFGEDKWKWYKIGLFLVISVLIGGLSIGGYFNLYNSSADYNTEKNIYIAMISLSWFAFVSFIFLLLNRTRELNLILYGSLLGLSAAVLSELEDDKYTQEEKDEHSQSNSIATTIMVFSAIAVGYLLFYYAIPDPTKEILKYREENEKRNFEEKLLEKIRKAQKEAIEEEEKNWKALHLKPKEKLSIIEKALANLEKSEKGDKKDDKSGSTG